MVLGFPLFQGDSEVGLLLREAHCCQMPASAARAAAGHCMAAHLWYAQHDQQPGRPADGVQASRGLRLVDRQSARAQIGQLYQIFRVLGTPCDAAWPGVSQLPDWQACFPSWQPQDLGQVPPAHACISAPAAVQALQLPGVGHPAAWLPPASGELAACGYREPHCPAQALEAARGRCPGRPLTRASVQVVGRLGPEGLDLLRGLLQLDPARRISARSALAHPFFAPLSREVPTSGAPLQAERTPSGRHRWEPRLRSHAPGASTWPACSWWHMLQLPALHWSLVG